MERAGLDYGTATPTYRGTPSYAGFIFAGWSPAVAETVTGDVTYTAQWIYYNPAPANTEIEDEDVPLADIEDEEVPLADLPLFFEDVADDDWYREAGAYVYSNDLMVGLTDDVFGVYDKTTGRQLAAILYRYADSEKTADETYEGGVAWAAENGLTDGIDFDADANVTREQMVTICALRPSRSERNASSHPSGGVTDAGSRAPSSEQAQRSYSPAGEYDRAIALNQRDS